MRPLRPSFLLALAAAASAAAAAAAPVRLCGLSNAYKPALTDSCADGAPRVEILAARGEVEAGAVLLDNTAAGAARVADAGLEVRWDAGAPPAGVDTARGPRFLAYVHTEASPRYAGSVAGWFADALVPWPAAGGVPIAAGAQLSAWVSFNVSALAAPGTYTGALVMTGAGGAGVAPLPFALTVFSVTVPALADSPFRTVYAFDDGAPNAPYAPLAGYDVNATLRAYFDLLAELRFPATNIYANKPLPDWQYAYLAAQGSATLILADISDLPAPPGSFKRGGGGGGGGDNGGGGGGRARRGPSSAARGAVSAGVAAGDCPTFSQAYVDFMVSYLTPAWDALGALGVQSRATVYGFDEIDASCEPVVRQLFAAAKAAFPGVRTLSAIDWPSVPLDLPLDVWVLQYQLVNRSVTDPWIAAGHELYVYHCIEPSEPGYLNTFNERALVEARLLFLFDFMLDVTGHLYYDVALWLSWTASPPFWASYTTGSGVSFAAGAHGVLGAYGDGDDPRLLGWDPANWIWAPRTDIWANGDGVFVYPGPLDARGVGQPVSTVRFEAQRDGVEDWHIARAVPDRARAKALVGALVSAPNVFSANVTLLAQVRRELLTLASAAGA